MKRAAQHYAQAVVAALDTGDDLSGVLERLKSRLRKDRARKMYHRIIRVALKDLEAAHGIQTIAATVARDEMKTVLQQELGRHLQATVVLADSIRPDVLGGAIVRVDDTQVDGTVVRALSSLRKALSGVSHLNQSTTNHDETE